MRAFPIFCIMILLCIVIGIQGSAHAQTTNDLQLIRQWNISNIFNNPNGIAVDHNGNVYVADTGNNAIKEIFTNGSIATLVSGFSGPNGVAVDSDGNVYVADGGSDRVKEIRTNGTVITLPSLITPYQKYDWGGSTTNLYGVAVDSNDTVYAGYYGYGWSTRYGNSHSGISIIEKIFADGNVKDFNVCCQKLSGVAEDVRDNIYITGTYSDNWGSQPHPSVYNPDVFEIDNDGTNMISLGGGFNQPVGIAADPNGDVYVVDNGDNTVREILSDGEMIILGSNFNDPHGIAVDSYGDLFIIDNDAIREFVPTSDFVVVPNATYVSDTIPNAMVVGQSYPVSVTMRNTGTAAWTSNLRYMLAVWGQTWNFNLQNDTNIDGIPAYSIPGIVNHGSGWIDIKRAAVQPGQTYTWNFTFSPQWPGEYGIGFQVVDGSADKWLGDYGSKTITIGAPIPNSSYAGDSIPDTMKATNEYMVTINFTNTGNMPWTNGKGDKLTVWGQTWNFNLQNDTSIDGLPAYSIPAGVTVLPGQTYSWKIKLSPQWAGSSGIGYQVVEGSTDNWLGDYGSKTITIGAPISNSSYVGDSIPDTMAATNEYMVAINFTNTGNMLWTSGKGDKLAVWGQTWNFNLQNDTSFDGQPAYSIPAGITVQPGQTYTWNIKLSPQWTGSSGIGFQVVEGSTGKWLGDYGSKTITISPPIPNSSYAGDSIPDTMKATNEYIVAINFTNTGNTAWNSGNGDMLAVWGQTWNLLLLNDTSIDGVPAYSIPPGITVLPGQTYTWYISFWPQWSGSYGIGFQVVEASTGKWLGSYGSKTMTVN